MWLASLLVAWLAAEHQALRHIRALRRSIIAFAGGSRTVDPPDLLHAPNELRDVGDAYERLVDSVLHDAAELEDTVHQKEVLLREVHHRVKNNLQLIASIMNIQMRKAVSPEAKLLVKGLHDRVMSLATVHRELYQTTGLTDVRADELLAMIVAQVLRMGSTPGQQIETTTDFDPIRLTPDQAVPLSLILTEALTNVLKHAGRGEDGRIWLTVSLRQVEDGRAVLRVTNSLRAGPAEAVAAPDVDSTNLGEQLLAAFAMQLNGDLSAASEDGEFRVKLDFPVRELNEGGRTVHFGLSRPRYEGRPDGRKPVLIRGETFLTIAREQNRSPEVVLSLASRKFIHLCSAAACASVAVRVARLSGCLQKNGTLGGPD